MRLTMSLLDLYASNYVPHQQIKAVFGLAHCFAHGFNIVSQTIFLPKPCMCQLLKI